MTTNFKNRYDSTEAVVVQPFTYKLVNGLHTFTAVVKDGSKQLKVWQHNITYTLCNDRQTARSVFAQEKTKAENLGYGGASTSSDTLYHAYIGDYDKVGSKEVTIDVCSAGSSCGYSFYLSFENYFPVVTDYKTRVE